MSYAKNTWQTGDVVTAEKLNRMEEGIEAASYNPVLANAKSTGGIGWTEQGEQTVITWDGDTEGRERIVLQNDELFLYRISNFDQAFYGDSELLFDFSFPEPRYQNISTNECYVITSIDGNAKLYIYNETPVLCIANNTTEFSIDGEMYSVPNEGIYFIAVGEGYISKLTHPNIHQIADKYLLGAIKRATEQFITFEELDECVRYWDDAHKTASVSGNYITLYLKYDNGNYYINNLDDLFLAREGFVARLLYNIERSTSGLTGTFHCALPCFYDTTGAGGITFTNQRRSQDGLKTDFIDIHKDGSVTFITI